MEMIQNRIGMQFCFSVSLIGRGGRLVMLWFDEFILEIINFIISHIHSKIRGGGLKEGVCLKEFYGMPDTSKRGEFWELLVRINQEPNATGVLSLISIKSQSKLKI